MTKERRITPERIERFAALTLEQLQGDNPALRQFYVRSVVDRIEVGDAEIRIIGSNKALEHPVARLDRPVKTVVPSIEREWCARLDSNQRPQA